MADKILTDSNGKVLTLNGAPILEGGKKMGYGIQFLLEPTQHIIFSFDFEPKAIIFSSGIMESYIDAYLPTVEGKTVYSFFACNYIPNALTGGLYTVQNFTRYTKGDTSNAFIGTSSVQYLFDVVYNSQTQKWDVDMGLRTGSQYFTFAGATNQIVSGYTGIPYQIIAFG